MKEAYVIKMGDGTFFIQTHGNCGWEADYSIDRRTAVFATKERCEIEIMQIKQHFRSFDGRPYRITVR